MINKTGRVKTGFHVALGVLSGAVLLTAIVLCDGVSGAGPGFVAVTQGLMLCAYAAHITYTEVKGIRRGRASLAVSVVVTAVAMQQSILWGGLTRNSFQMRVSELSGFVLNKTMHSCLGACWPGNGTEAAAAFRKIMAGFEARPLDFTAELAMSVWQTLVFLAWLPYTLAHNLATSECGGSLAASPRSGSGSLDHDPGGEGDGDGHRQHPSVSVALLQREPLAAAHARRSAEEEDDDDDNGEEKQSPTASDAKHKQEQQQKPATLLAL